LTLIFYAVTFTNYQEYIAGRDDFGPTPLPIDPHAGGEVSYSDKKGNLVAHGFTQGGWSFCIKVGNLK